MPDLWMLDTCVGPTGRRWNRRAAAMLSGYRPFKFDEDEPQVNPFRKRQYRRAWEIGRLMGDEVAAKS